MENPKYYPLYPVIFSEWSLANRSSQTCALCFRHQIQHYTNQIAKETNKYLKDLSHLPQPSNQSDQVHIKPFSIVIVPRRVQRIRRGTSFQQRHCVTASLLPSVSQSVSPFVTNQFDLLFYLMLLLWLPTQKSLFALQKVCAVGALAYLSP